MEDNNYKKILQKKGRFLDIRPFREDSKESLIKIAKKELKNLQVEIPSLIVTELGFHRKDPAARKEMSLLFQEFELKPIKWLYPVRKELKKMKFNPNRSGKHSLYSILLKYPSYPYYGIYVGESKFSFEERYKQHKNDDFTASRHPRDYGVEILYSVTGFFHPPNLQNPGPDRSYAKNLEEKIGVRLKKDIFKTKGLPRNRVKGCH